MCNQVSIWEFLEKENGTNNVRPSVNMGVLGEGEWNKQCENKYIFSLPS
jgi:hypothetical protein